MPFGSEGAKSGIGLALSGGGLRATRCHWGALLRPCSSLYVSVSGLTAVMLFLLSATPTEAQTSAGLTIRDAAFTDDVIERAPRARLRELSLGPDGAPARIWFWFAINCTGRCLESLPENRRIGLEVHWYYDTGGSLTQRLVSQIEVEASDWRAWVFADGLRSGRWKVMVRSSALGRLCRSDDECDFIVEVRP
jgi:hypothetical protein